MTDAPPFPAFPLAGGALVRIPETSKGNGRRWSNRVGDAVSSPWSTASPSLSVSDRRGLRSDARLFRQASDNLKGVDTEGESS